MDIPIDNFSELVPEGHEVCGASFAPPEHDDYFLASLYVHYKKRFRVEVGKWYMRRDGLGPFKVVECLGITDLFAYIDADGHRRYIRGSGYWCGNEPSELDLVEEVPAPTKYVVPTLQMLADAGGIMDCWVRDNDCDDRIHRKLVAVLPGRQYPFLTTDDGIDLFWWKFAEVEVPYEGDDRDYEEKTKGGASIAHGCGMLFFTLLLFVVVFISCCREERTWGERIDEIKQQGRKARAAGASAEANPYMTVSQRVRWMEGWVDEN